MKSSNVLLLISIVYFTFCGVTLANKYPSDILTNPKDDCGNVCGKQNQDVKDNKCGDTDKRTLPLLQIHDENDENEEKTEYYEARTFECVKECPTNYKSYEKICVKDVEEFKKDLITKTDTIDEKLDYTWWIVGGVAGLLIVALIVAFVFIKQRSG